MTDTNSILCAMTRPRLNGTFLSFFAVAALALATLGVPSSSEARGVGSCKSGQASASGVGAISRLLTTSVSGLVTLRQQLGLDGSSPSSVSVSSDEALCARGSELADSLAGKSSASGAPIYLFLVGTSHRVVDPSRAVGSEFTSAYVFDSTWAYRGKMLIPNSSVP